MLTLNTTSEIHDNSKKNYKNSEKKKFRLGAENCQRY